jgi:hypothetical protein
MPREGGHFFAAVSANPSTQRGVKLQAGGKVIHPPSITFLLQVRPCQRPVGVQEYETVDKGTALAEVTGSRGVNKDPRIRGCAPIAQLAAAGQ